MCVGYCELCQVYHERPGQPAGSPGPQDHRHQQEPSHTGPGDGWRPRQVPLFIMENISVCILKGQCHDADQLLAYFLVYQNLHIFLRKKNKKFQNFQLNFLLTKSSGNVPVPGTSRPFGSVPTW
jgi:hypothetical protein